MPISNVPYTSQLVPLSTEWQQWLEQVRRVASILDEAGVTSNRPTRDLWIGRSYYDTTLGKPIWWSGTAWKDATGATV